MKPETYIRKREYGLAESVKTFAERSLAARINRHSSDGKLACRGLPQFFSECKKITWLIGLERDDVFLLAEPEGMCEVDLYIRKLLPDHEAFLDQGVSFAFLDRVPVLALGPRVEEKVFLFTGVDVKTVLDAVRHEHSFLGNRKIVIRGFEEIAKACPVEFCGHVLDKVERGSDTPEHKVRLGIESYERIAEKQEIVAVFTINTFEFGLERSFRFSIEFTPLGIDPQEHVANELPVDTRELLPIFRLRHKTQSALLIDLFRRIRAFHFVWVEARMSTQIFCQHLKWKSKFRIQFVACHGRIFTLFTNHSFNVRIGDMLRWTASAFLVLLAACMAAAQQRPLLTDDVDIVPQGTIDIGAGVEFLQNAKFPLSGLKGDLTKVGDIRIRTGFAPNVEFQVEGTLQNFLAINSQTLPSPIPLSVTGNSTDDFGDFIVSTKIKLINERASFPAVGIKLGFQIPNTDQAKGIGTNQINIFTKFLVGKKFGKRSGRTPLANIYGNLGLAIMTAPIERFTQNDVLLYGLAGIFRVSDHINIVGEVNGRANTRKGVAPLGTESIGQFRIGSQIKASGLTFDTAAVLGLTSNSPRTGIVFGVTYQTPPIFTPAK